MKVTLVSVVVALFAGLFLVKLTGLSLEPGPDESVEIVSPDVAGEPVG